MRINWKYVSIGLGVALVGQFVWWNRQAPQVLNLPHIPLLSR
jgi:hypothetical protein